LTPDGELFLPFAERILELSSEAADRLGSGRTQVSLGVVEELAESAALHATLLAWRTRWPDLQMNLHIQSGAALHAAFEAGRLDLLVADPLIRDGAPRPLWRREVRLVWAALPGFDAAARPLALALYPPPCQWRDRVVQALELAGVRFRVAVQSGGLSAMRAAAGSGLALAAMLPMSVTPGLVVVPHQSVELPLAPSIEIACYQKRRGDRRLDEVQAMLEGVLIAHG
jgi:DNA-binding transcriptional LysR family regulator